MEVRFLKKTEKSLVPTNFNSPDALGYSYLLLALKALKEVRGTQRESQTFGSEASSLSLLGEDPVYH